MGPPLSNFYAGQRWLLVDYVQTRIRFAPF